MLGHVFFVGTVVSLVWLPALVSLGLDRPESGEWSLSSDGVLMSLWAEQAPLSEVLQGVQSVAGISLSFGPIPGTNVTVRCVSQSLDELLGHLHVSFLITYQANERGEDLKPESAWVGRFKPAGPESTPFVFTPPTEVGASPESGAGGISKAARKILQQAIQDPAVLSAFPDDVIPYPVATPVTLQLDGSTSDWPEGIPWEFVQLGHGVEVGESQEDASFRLAGVASEDHLFFAARIRDDAKAVFEGESLEHGRDDALKLFLQPTDELGEIAGRAFSMTVNRHHVFQSAAGSGGSSLKTAPRQYVSNSQGLRAVIVDGVDGWTVEMSIPLDRLGANASTNPSMLFQVSLMDFDAGQEHPDLLEWSRSERLESDPERSAGGLRLVPIPR